MRESQMKKIIATAVAAAFAAPVMAADVTLSGTVEFNMNDVNGTTTSATDSAFKVAASTETANGIGVSGQINVEVFGDEEDGTIDANGGDALTLTGPFGTLDLGDTSSAADKYDDKSDWGKLNGTSTLAGDAAIGWTLPATIENLSVYVSHAADGGEGDKHTGVAFQYKAGPVTVAYAKNEEEAAESNLTYAGASATFQGLTVAIESMQDEAGGSSAKIDEDVIGVKYGMGDVTLFATSYEKKVAGTLTSDVSAYGLHYNLGGGVTFFVEGSQDDKNSAADSTGAGIEMAF
jgi:hypothetical protein